MSRFLPINNINGRKVFDYRKKYWNCSGLPPVTGPTKRIFDQNTNANVHNRAGEAKIQWKKNNGVSLCGFVAPCET